MKLTATISALILAISLNAQCVSDTTYFSSHYKWVLCIDHSFITETIETSAQPELFSMKSSVMPAVVITNVRASTETIRVKCENGESHVSSRLFIPENPQYEPIDWMIYADMSSEVRFEEVSEDAPAIKTSYR